ncbi:hypothetical protein C8J57DRAFT_1221655 [Mycena rebaudengoi]|nr:hypothetical protein C8J57DRAFT_1221655 [Mycena rebaudengoi]
MSQEASVFATRYLSAVGVAALLYDHLLTSGDELSLIWFNSAAGIGNRLGFIINSTRIALSGGSHGLTVETCQVFIWIFGTSNTIVVAISHCAECHSRSNIYMTKNSVIIVGRLYTLWDRRKGIKWILIVAFGIAISLSMAFSILAVHQVQPLVWDPIGIIFLGCSLSSQTAFDLFIIIMTVINALDKPYQRQAEVMTSLQHDGARIFVPDNCFVTLTFSRMVWTMCSVANSRLQLRVEGLRFIRFTSPANGDITIDTEFELYDVYG